MGVSDQGYRVADHAVVPARQPLREVGQAMRFRHAEAAERVIVAMMEHTPAGELNASAAGPEVPPGSSPQRRVGIRRLTAGVEQAGLEAGQVIAQVIAAPAPPRRAATRSARRPRDLSVLQRADAE